MKKPSERIMGKYKISEVYNNSDIVVRKLAFAEIMDILDELNARLQAIEDKQS